MRPQTASPAAPAHDLTQSRLEPRARRFCADGVERRRLGLAAQHALAAGPQARAIALESQARGLRAQDPVAGLLGELLHAGGHVDRIADQRELQLGAAADGPGEHAPAVDADADPDVAVERLSDAAVDLARGGQGAVGMVGVVLGHAEDAEQSVADELVRMSAVVLQHGHDDLEELVQPRDPPRRMLWRSPRGPAPWAARTSKPRSTRATAAGGARRSVAPVKPRMWTTITASSPPPPASPRAGSTPRRATSGSA